LVAIYRPPEGNTNNSGFSFNDNKLHEVFPHFMTTDEHGLFFTFDITKYDKILAIDIDGNTHQIDTENAINNETPTPSSLNITLTSESDDIEINDIEFLDDGTFYGIGKYENNACIYKIESNKNLEAYQFTNDNIKIYDYKNIMKTNSKLYITSNIVKDKKSYYAISEHSTDLSNNKMYIVNDTIRYVRNIRNNEYIWAVSNTNGMYLFKVNGNTEDILNQTFDAIQITINGKAYPPNAAFIFNNKLYLVYSLWNSATSSDDYYLVEVDLEKGTNKFVKFKINNSTCSFRYAAATVDKDYIYFALGYSSQLLLVFKINRNTFKIENKKAFTSAGDGKKHDVNSYYMYISGDNIVIVNTVNNYPSDSTSGFSVLKINKNDLSIVDNYSIVSKTKYSSCNIVKLCKSFIIPIICKTTRSKITSIFLVDFVDIENINDLNISDDQYVIKQTTHIFDEDPTITFDILDNTNDSIVTSKTTFQFSINTTIDLTIEQMTTNMSLNNKYISTRIFYNIAPRYLDIQPSSITFYFINYSEILSILASIKLLLVDKTSNKILQLLDDKIVQTDININDINDDILKNYSISLPLILNRNINYNTDNIKVLIFTDQQLDSLKLKYKYAKPILIKLKNPINLSKFNNIQKIILGDEEITNIKYVFSPDGNKWYTLDRGIKEIDINDYRSYSSYPTLQFKYIKDIITDKIYFAFLIDENTVVPPILIEYIDDSGKILVTYQHEISLNNEKINIKFNEDGNYVVVYF
jgi:hypothetical protein